MKGPWDFLVGVAELILIVAWHIWWEWRQIVHTVPVQTPHCSALAIGALAANYARAKKKVVPGLRHGWACPPKGLMKVNIDAAFDVHEGRGSTRVIVRDLHGKFVSASCLCLPYVSEAMTAEG